MGASFENEKVETFSVVHETYLVKKYDRSDQYINAKLATKDGFLEGYWQGTEVRDINVSMISVGASSVNLTFMVDKAHIEEAIKRLHRVCFEAETSDDRIGRATEDVLA